MNQMASDLFDIEAQVGSNKNDRLDTDSIFISRLARGASQKERRNFDRDTDINATLIINGTPHKILDMSRTGLCTEKAIISKAQNRKGAEINGVIEYQRSDGRWFAQKAILVIVSVPSEPVIRLAIALLLGSKTDI